MSIVKGALNPVVTGSATFSGNTSVAQLTSLYTSPVAASIAATAVDVFVYDTRKDSDGGAWRKRCQNTSWYNETLNTATRGSRKEFPAVAVIVATSTTLTIYDGDDPSLPMWMVFSLSTTINFWATGSPATSVVAQNGIIYVGSSGGGLRGAHFIRDAMSVGYTLSSGAYTPLGNIVNRNDTYTNWAQSDKYYFQTLAGTILDLAITVLPGALIDPATGIAIPTLAVATGGGVTIFKHDWTVETTDTAAIQQIGFTKGDRLAYGHRGGYEYGGRAINVNPLRNSLTYGFYGGSTIPSLGPLASDAGMIKGIGDGYVYAYGGTNGTNGIKRISEDEYYRNYGMANYISTQYNTGWMHGDIKGAWLCSNTAETITGTELVTNWDFSNGTTGWSAAGTGASISNNAGRLSVTTGTDAWGGAYTTVQVVAGKTYVITGTIVDNGGGWAGISGNIVGANNPSKVFNGAQPNPASYVFTYTATATGSLYINIDHSNLTSTNTILADNISCRLADLDRSVNTRGVQILGSLTKSAVATGADLMAYSGFSASNFLYMPYTSALDLGTGDFSVSAWAYNTDSTGYSMVFSRSDDAGTVQIQLLINSGQWRFITGSVSTYAGTPTVNAWQHVVFVRRSGVHYLYLNGALAGSATAAGTVSVTGANVAIGNNSQPTSWSTQYFKGSLSMVRFSATAPSADQIKKMYDDEKVLFQPGAKSTIYGSSDAVLAIAYDDATNLVHVGTSAGRSVFQGLRRVDNTTTAITTAISASNGMVVEQ